ncbi:helix-turn-helix domain-containing protein [Rhodococcus tibetensis]|uniref:Helix-turn-helix domain-containing protein n=1 Tax=Rhodococcus tibetensis TaxID=2965064 RepID=A0ABT1QFK7_9NOCA|nr:helix-turn-helix transcriptional regulator [Rhodococcus sp. FXJ9.536]MCQ4120448.1 helix-turn-helix domain-containing protein [Rhodococcus sp. FXJ9.536]
MATRRVETGLTGNTVRENIARVRKEQRLTLRDLAERLSERGRPMAHNTLSEIERGARRVDVDDLVAIAVALDISPSTLLVPDAKTADDLVQMTATEEIPAINAWRFLTAEGAARRAFVVNWSMRAKPDWVIAHEESRNRANEDRFQTAVAKALNIDLGDA